MPTDGRIGGAFQFKDPRQERIHRRLLLVSPGPAAFYRDACRLMSEENPLASTTHLVAHLLREIESGVRDVLETVTDQSARLKKGASGDEQHRDEIRAILKELEIPETDPVAVAWLRLPGSKNSYGLAARAHREDLAAPRRLDSEFKEFWNEMETILDRILERFEERYVTWHKQFDQLAQKTSPTPADAQFLRLHFPNNLAAVGDFFNRLSTPAWLVPLFDEGLFAYPPEPEHDEEKGTIGLMGWPQSRYLARMAESAPKEVLDIILAIPDTKNTRVHLDFVNAASAMPAEMSAQLVPKMKTWIEGRFGLSLPRNLGRLMEQLAQGDQLQPALELARALLALLPDSRPPRPLDESKKIFAQREPRPKFDAGEYGEIVKNNLPALIDKAGEQAFSMLCDVLEDAIKLSMPPGEKPTAEDLSYVWRSAIEDHAQNFGYEIKSSLVDAVRNAAEQIADDDPSRVPGMVRSLRKRRFRVFRRMAHHLLRKFPDADPASVVKTLMSRGLLARSSMWHEYSLLLRESFRLLSAAEQTKLLGWIDRGPAEKGFRLGFEKAYGKPPSAEQLADYTKAWKRDRLALISDDLLGEWKQRFSELVTEVGPSDHPEFSTHRNGGAWGFRSPKTAKDLATRSIEEIVDFLKTWESPADWTGPSPEGLGRELTALVNEDPDRFAKAADQFIGLDPTYVRSVIQGLEEASKKNVKFTWPQVLKLCRWVAEQPRDIAGRSKNQREADPDWGWTWKAISSLLTSGLQSESNPIPFELRAGVWEVIQRLVLDPEPTAETEAEYARSKMDPVAISLNAERPKAMHTVISYALWVKKNLEAESAGESKLDSDELWFAKMPEVQKVLEDHLDPRTDRSVGVRSIYGQWLPSLFILDRAWVAQNISKIFPAEAGEEELLKAAWDAYVAWCRPSWPLGDLLREQYMKAIGRIPAGPVESNYPHDSSERVAEHLLMLYGWGKLDIADPLLTELFTKAPDRIRGHAFHQIGFALYHEKNTVPPEIMERFKALWKQRLAVAKNATDKKADITELLAFGWWFAGNKLDDDWAISHLYEVLKLIGKVEVDHLVVRRLARMVEQKPREVVECLSLMVDGAKEPYEIVGWDKDAKAILSSALKSSDVKAKDNAIALINRLDARGHSGFRELLG